MKVVLVFAAIALVALAVEDGAAVKELDGELRRRVRLLRPHRNDLLTFSLSL